MEGGELGVAERLTKRRREGSNGKGEVEAKLALDASGGAVEGGRIDRGRVGVELPGAGRRGWRRRGRECRGVGR